MTDDAGCGDVAPADRGPARPAPGRLQRRPGLVAEIRRRLRMYRTFARIPDNRHVTAWAAVSPHLGELPERLGLRRERARRRRLRRYESDLRLLNDVLSRSPLAGRYWVWAGLLLGWAREGRVLPHDVGDADFAYDADDAHLIDQAEPLLLASGFRRWYVYRNNGGELVQRVYVRHGFKFEFFRMIDVGGGRHEFNGYDAGDSGPVEVVGRVPRQRLEPFEFLGRTWMKPEDHDLSLTCNYGEWRTPDPGWNGHGLCVVEQHPWRPAASPDPHPAAPPREH